VGGDRRVGGAPGCCGGGRRFLRGTRTKVAAKRRAGLDAIVVGAGVAGSALAYTLGKVILSSALAPSPSSMWPH
jgi:hypothetical protein